MANYYGKGRTNYFSVTDEAALRKIVESIPELVLVEDAGQFMIYERQMDGSGWPLMLDGDDNEVDYFHSIATLLKPGSVMVVFEIGSEKYRYFVGRSTAYRCVYGQVETLSLGIEEIDLLVKEKWGLKTSVFG